MPHAGADSHHHQAKHPTPPRQPHTIFTSGHCRRLRRSAKIIMAVIKTLGATRNSGTISPAVLVLAQVITTIQQPWASRALCAQIDPDLFFSDSVTRTERAKATCRQCPVRNECLAHALKTREDFGVWGGLDRDQRRQLLRRRPRQPHKGDTR